MILILYILELSLEIFLFKVAKLNSSYPTLEKEFKKTFQHFGLKVKKYPKLLLVKEMMVDVKTFHLFSTVQHD